MAAEIAGSHTNGTMEDSGSASRDVKNHMLFEVSTEVANRGSRLQKRNDFQKESLTMLQLVESTLS